MKIFLYTAKLTCIATFIGNFFYYYYYYFREWSFLKVLEFFFPIKVVSSFETFTQATFCIAKLRSKTHSPMKSSDENRSASHTCRYSKGLCFSSVKSTENMLAFLNVTIFSSALWNLNGNTNLQLNIAEPSYDLNYTESSIKHTLRFTKTLNQMTGNL